MYSYFPCIDTFHDFIAHRNAMKSWKVVIHEAILQMKHNTHYRVPSADEADTIREQQLKQAKLLI